MPYVTESDRDDYDKMGPTSVGQLTYGLTKLCVTFKKNQGPLRFLTIALVMGALLCTALEFYRRVAVPYEDSKLATNGDVYE